MKNKPDELIGGGQLAPVQDGFLLGMVFYLSAGLAG